MLPQQYCLRWKYHHSNLQTMFSQLLDRGCFCDVTLACEGQLIRAHRVVLCACSTFFDNVLTYYANERDPIVIMRDVTFADIKCLIEFMYKGEINVEHANLASLLKTADDLKIKGLAEVTWRDDDDQPPPTPQTEFLSPTLQRASTNAYEHADYAAGNVGGGHDNQQQHQSQKTRTRTPEELESNRHKTTYSPKQHCVSQTSPRILSLPVVPTSTVSGVTAASSQIDGYMGQKRKRGRPPLDDSYDVFNVKKLHGEINTNNTPVTLADNPQYNENMRELALESGDLSPRRTAVAAYQQHIYKLRARPKSLHPSNTSESEWINTNLESSENQRKIHDLEEDERLETERQDWKITNNVEGDPRNRKHEYRTHEKTPEQQKIKITKRKSLKGDNNASLEMKSDVLRKNEKSENTKYYAEKGESGKATHVKDADVIKEEQVSDGENTSKMKKPNSSPSSNVSSSSSSSDTATHTGTKKSNHSMSAAAQLAHTYSTYCPEGYMINEHGMLMTHDFAHPPIPDVPTSSAAAANGHSTEEYTDIKMEEFNEYELTSEEMSQWQDVIKMDDYLAKGRRPQFWEEPFTRRVLEAIKGKRLEMKKAARILGVSYGTLYGRYRETYGCIKHPYNSTSMRGLQGSALSVPSRFDIVWPPAKPGQLDIGKLRPKDVSELWTRPQI